MSNIKEYLPQILRAIKELTEICRTEDVEFNSIDNLVNRTFSETIIKTATVYGIERYEKILGLITEPRR